MKVVIRISGRFQACRRLAPLLEDSASAPGTREVLRCCTIPTTFQPVYTVAVQNRPEKKEERHACEMWKFAYSDRARH